MRIVFLTHNYPRFPGDVSGSFLATLARALVDQGAEVRVIAPSDGGETGSPTLDGIPVRRVRYAAPHRETLAYRGTMADAARSPAGAVAVWSLITALRRAAREEVALGANLIHAHWWVPAGVAAPRGVPLVVTVHGTDAALLERSWLARRLARSVFGRAQVVTAVSPNLAQLVERATGRGIGPGFRQPMPIDSSAYRSWSAGGGGLVLVGRLTAQKRVDLALRALAVSGHGQWVLTVIGEGPERPALESLRDRLGLGTRVRFLGATPPSRVAELLAAADLVLFPAKNEGFGLAAAEALMAGVPVVACTDGGGVLTIVPPTGAGRHVEPTPEAYARAIDELLADREAPARARELGTGWRERLSPATVALACRRWYEEALRG